MEIMRDNKIRIFYVIVCIIILHLCIKHKSDIIDTNANMILFSYYASVATVIALIVSVMEILHNVNMTKSLKKRSLSHLNKFKNATGLSLSHDCIAYYNQSLDNLANKKFPLLVANFTIAQKLHLNIANNFMSGEDKRVFDSEINKLNDLEKQINATRHVTPKSPLGNAQVKEISEALLDIKQRLEAKYTFKKSED